MKNVSFEKAYLPLPGFCLSLLQNVSAEDQQSLATAVDALRSQSMTDVQKAYTLGLLLMNLAGSDVLSAAVRALSKEISR